MSETVSRRLGGHGQLKLVNIRFMESRGIWMIGQKMERYVTERIGAATTSTLLEPSSDVPTMVPDQA
jgi:hypothetical protein